MLYSILWFIKHLLCDGRSSDDLPLNHLLGDLTGHHAAGLRVLRGHHHAVCFRKQQSHHQTLTLVNKVKANAKAKAIPEKKGSLCIACEMLVRVVTSVGMWKTSLLVIDLLLYWDIAPAEGSKELIIFLSGVLLDLQVYFILIRKNIFFCKSCFYPVIQKKYFASVIFLINILPYFSKLVAIFDTNWLLPVLVNFFIVSCTDPVEFNVLCNVSLKYFYLHLVTRWWWCPLSLVRSPVWSGPELWTCRERSPSGWGRWGWSQCCHRSPGRIACHLRKQTRKIKVWKRQE